VDPRSSALVAHRALVQRGVEVLLQCLGCRKVRPILPQPSKRVDDDPWRKGGIVEGGEWASTVLDKVVAYGRYGVKLGQSPAEAEADLRVAIAEACATDGFLRDHPATVEITGGRFGSARVPSDHPLPAGLADVVERVTGRRPALLGEPYGADMQMFVNHGDTPCVIFGPGDVRVAHSADEHVPLDEVETCARVLAEWVRSEIGAT